MILPVINWKNDRNVLTNTIIRGGFSMAIAWTPDLSVGIENIDEQHKIWFQKANELFEAGKQQKAKEYMNTMIDFLDEYTKKHFKDEEAYMNKIRYPEIDAQKRAHASFINDLAKLKKDFNEAGGNILVILNANKMVINWLTNHIRNMDKKIGEYAKTL
jgi:hemerythrin